MSNLIRNTTDRVRQNTPDEINHRIDQLIERRIAFYRQNPDWIDARLGELAREWDTERSLGTNSSILSLVGLFFTITKSRLWILLPIVVQGFFLQHQLTGFCPPLLIMRRMGVRTPHEIDREREALISLREEGALGSDANGGSEAHERFVEAQA
ncbi:MAG: hypothetical protein ACFCVE_14345 [Phycisphaerae bacterium]